MADQRSPETTCCVCLRTDLASTERRKVIKGKPGCTILSDLGNKLNRIASITTKLPSSVIVVVCRQCKHLVDKVLDLESNIIVLRKKIVDLVSRHSELHSPFYSRSIQKQSTVKRCMSPSFKGSGISPVSKKLASFIVMIVKSDKDDNSANIHCQIVCFTQVVPWEPIIAAVLQCLW